MNGRRTMTLDECTRIVSGATPSTSISQYWDGEICWATPKDLSELSGPYLDDTPRKITEAGLRSCAAEVLPPGAVLFSSRAPIGHVAINRVPTATNQGFKSFVPVTDRLDSKYLYYWLQYKRPYLESLGNGATFKEISKAIVSRIEIELPPLSEQRRIAAILDRAESLQQVRSASLLRMQDLGAAIFKDMFGDPVLNPKRFSRATLVELCDNDDDIRCGPFGTQLSRSEYAETGVPLWGIKHVNASFRTPTTEFLTHRKAEELSNYCLRPGDIAMTRKGTIGNCALYPLGFQGGIMHSDLLRLRLSGKRCDAAFVSFQLHVSRDVNRQLGLISGGAVMPGINVTKLKQIEVLVPPLSVQLEFAKRLATCENRQDEYRTSQLRMDRLFFALQHRAFRGEL